MLHDISSKNASKSSNQNKYNATLKKFFLYLYYIGGRLLYETLQSNLPKVIPTISSLNRYIAENSTKLDEGVMDFQELKLFLEERNLKKFVWISEDATRITGRIEYDSRSNKVVGFVLPLRNGLPETNHYIASSAQTIQEYFKIGTKAHSAYIHNCGTTPI
ncbi:hypothetical protein Zmor_021677 [Zophobas morio]|uniref:Uncharacterized protein n=1 Tax=Zophobas morio TaxID=2755281 RepID=A0AA38I9P6_9CUCU|nr:hypothetical protein Zmor_021677 [Zophobas morio]